MNLVSHLLTIHALMGFALTAGAQTAPLPRSEVPRAALAPTVDGTLDEAIWKTAPTIDLQAGVARFCWAPEGLYIGFESQDSTIISSTATAGQSLHQGDVFELFIDPIGDHLQYAEIQVNADDRTFFMNHVLTAPPRLTSTYRLTPEFCESELWSHGMPAPEGFSSRSQVHAESQTWTAEIFLPAPFLNRRRGGTALEARMVLHLNLARYDWHQPQNVPDRKGNFHYWVSVESGCPHISPTRMGAITLGAAP